MLLAQIFMEGSNESDHWAAHEKTGFFGAQGAGCLFFATNTGRFLIAHRSNNPPPYNVEQPGTWGTFGGAMDRAETPDQAVRREVYEECGYTGSMELVPLHVFKKGTFSYYNFLAVVNDEFDPELNWETQGYRWCKLGKWPSPLHFGLNVLFNDPASMATMKRFARASQIAAAPAGSRRTGSSPRRSTNTLRA